MVPVARFRGSRLASAPSPSPFQQSLGRTADVQARKVARLSSSANVGAAIVEAENSLEIEVCFLLLERHFNVILTPPAIL